MSIVEKMQGRQHVVSMLSSGDVGTWPEIMDRLESNVSNSGDAEDQKRYSKGFVSGVTQTIRELRDRLARESKKEEA